MLKNRIGAIAATLIASIALSNFLIPGMGASADVTSAIQVNYSTHVQNVGWQGAVSNGAAAGTTGQSLRLEALKVSLDTTLDLGIEYRSHIQNIGWEQNWHANGDMSGTEGQSLRLEALEIRLTGSEAANYDVWYCTHVQNIGWMDWVSNGERSGTEGFSLRQEGLAIVILPKGSPAPANLGGSTTPAAPVSNDPVPTASGLSYSTHVQNIGWQDYAAAGATAGTEGQALRLEAIRINLSDIEGVGIQYMTHIQNIGWEATWKNNNELSGTQGQSLRLEAIRIQLTGPNASNYDIYYRTHVQNIGWTDWAYNGNPCGSAGYSYRLEAIQIQILPAGSAAPGSTVTPFHQEPGQTQPSIPSSGVGDLNSYPAEVQPYVNSVSDSAFESSIAGFPESYKPYLRYLHSIHPSWSFAPVDCGDWNSALDLETRDNVSLVSSAAPQYWDPNRTWIADAGGWRNATRECVAYFMDPRSQMNEQSVFQFADLRSTGAGQVNAEALRGMTDGTYLNGMYTAVYTSGINAGVNPVFVAAHALQECGTNGSISSNGSTGYYNHFNIGATNGNGAAQRGLNLARNGATPEFNARYNIPWNTPELSLENGSRWIYNNYFALGQQTLYLMRFNTRVNGSFTRGSHQYMCATASARNEGVRMYNGYSSGGIINTNIQFYIPVYSNMPDAACPNPG